MKFNTKRFLPAKGSDAPAEFDIICSRRIKMMPFGAGRRTVSRHRHWLGNSSSGILCVANLVWKFYWAVAEGCEMDLSEKQELVGVMKNPLHAHNSCRRLSSSASTVSMSDGTSCRHFYEALSIWPAQFGFLLICI